MFAKVSIAAKDQRFPDVIVIRVEPRGEKTAVVQSRVQKCGYDGRTAEVNLPGRWNPGSRFCYWSVRQPGGCRSPFLISPNL